MINQFAFEAVERTIRDLVDHTLFCSDDRILGGKLFALGVDFQQILHMYPRLAVSWR